MKYVILTHKRDIRLDKNGKTNGKKRCRTGTFNLKEALEFQQQGFGLGISIPKGYTVIDIDSKIEVKIFDSILDYYGIKTITQITPNGKHYWFKDNQLTKQGSIYSTACGLTVDTRVGHTDGYVAIIVAGEEIPRQWSSLGFPYSNDASAVTHEIPFWIRPLNKKLEKPYIDNQLMGDGDGRNDFLLQKRLRPLYDKNISLTHTYTLEECKEVANIINNFIFGEPLEDYEINNMFNNPRVYKQAQANTPPPTTNNDSDDSEGSDGLISSNLVCNKAPAIIQTSRNIINKYDLRYFNSSFFKPYKNSNSLYEPFKEGTPVWQSTIDYAFTVIASTYHKNVLTRMREESRVNTIIDKYSNSPFLLTKTNRNEIVFDNGILNIQNNTLRGFPENCFIEKFIPHNYIDNAFDKTLDDFLNEVFPIKEHRDLFLEFVASVIIDREQVIHKAVFLVGEGGNGKSTLFDMLKHYYGEDKVSNLQLKEFSESFGMETLINKWINMTDDEPIFTHKDSSKTKSVVSGGTQQINRKHKTHLTWTSSCKILGASNRAPTFKAESNKALKRRYIFIPMEQSFLKGKENPDMLKDITTESAFNYLSTLIIQAAKRIFANGFKLTEVQSLIDYTDNALESGNSAKRYIKEEYETIIDNPEGYVSFSYLYIQYQKWCEDQGVQRQYRVLKNNFLKDLIEFNVISFRSKVFNEPNGVSNPTIVIFKDMKITKPIPINIQQKLQEEKQKVGWL